MDTDATDTADGVLAVAGLMDKATAGLAARVAGIAASGEQWAQLLATVEASVGPGALILKLVIAVAASGIAARFAAGAVSSSRPWSAALAGGVAAAVLGSAAAHLLAAGVAPVRLTLFGAAIAVGLGFFALNVMDRLIRRPGGRSEAARRLPRLRSIWGAALAWALAGATATLSLRAFGAGAGLRDLVGTVLASLPALALFAGGAVLHRRDIAAAVAGRRPRSGFRAAAARAAPAGLVAGFVLLFLAGQAAQILGGRVAPLALIATAVALIALPFADAQLRAWAERAFRSGKRPAVRVALRRTARPAAFAAAIGLMLAVWSAPIIAALGATGDQAFSLAVKIAIVGLGASFIWNLVAVAEERTLSADGLEPDEAGESEEGAPRTRLETLAPLISATIRWTVAALAGLSVLVILGVNVWPLVTGLSVFGIAIGFGSQALVKDVVSGLFFLVDDAFRKGEYIEISGAKGVVEKISVRSVSLRHQRGALATIPYGAIGRVQNHSRDWVIEKLLFRVALETDVEQVRKLFKKIGLALAEDPELAPDMIEPFKSQGIAELDDGTLVIRGKFKARAGRQHLIRRKVLAAVHKAFQEAGVRSVAKPVVPGLKAGA